VISKNLYINIIIRVVAITLISVVTAWTIVRNMPALFIVSGIIAVITLTANLIWYINSTNRRLSYFFESVKNEDSTLSFPDTTNDRRLKEVSRSLDDINNQIRQLRIESRQQEQYFQAMLEHAATGIITINSAGFILHANSAAKKLLMTEVLTHISQLQRIDKNILTKLKDSEKDKQQLLSISSERGTVQLSLKRSTFRNGTEELMILSVQDIKNELDEKEVESWMKLIRVMMHEIINSISPITSLSETLLKLYTKGESAVLPETIKEKTIETTIQGLKVIRSQGNGLLSFIESYRKLTRLPKPEKINILAEDLLSSLKVLYRSFECKNKAALTVSCTPDDLMIFADETQITLCLINILKNAMQANEDNPDGKITIEAVMQNERPLISVTDNGTGIAPELIDEIFVPFYTTREEGSGIGLSISRQIMRLHGGSLRVKSTPGVETVFTMEF